MKPLAGSMDRVAVGWEVGETVGFQVGAAVGRPSHSGDGCSHEAELPQHLLVATSSC